MCRVQRDTATIGKGTTFFVTVPNVKIAAEGSNQSTGKQTPRRIAATSAKLGFDGLLLKPVTMDSLQSIFS